MLFSALLLAAWYLRLLVKIKINCGDKDRDEAKPPLNINYCSNQYQCLR
jgi:hypothetical protein